MTLLLDTRRVFVIILGLGLFALAARNVTDPDVWWHLRTGQLILHSHAIFHADPYSFTKFGQPWVNHEWLSDVLIFVLFRTAGWGGLIVFFAAVSAATFMVVFTRCAGRPHFSAGFAVWAAIASAPFWGVRPQTFTVLFASLFLLLLERSYVRPNLLWYTLPITLMWVNLHAGFALGIALMLLFLAGDLLDVALGFEEWPRARRRIQKLSLAIAACTALIPLNPYGFRMYFYPLQTVHSTSIQGYISEWFSPNFHQGMYLPVLLMMLAMLVAAVLSPLRLRPRDLLLLSVTAWAALHAARHIPVYALIAAPLLSRMTHAWLAKPQHGRFRGRQTAQQTRFRMFSATVIFFLAFATFVFVRVRYVIRKQAASEAQVFPASAVSFLSANRPAGPLLNHYNWGGYLIWYLYPEYQVYIDGRTDLYGDTFMDEFAKTYQVSEPSWKSTLDEWEIRTVILPPDAPLASALRIRSDWKQIYGDSQAVIFEKGRRKRRDE